MRNKLHDIYISIDIETAGPNPFDYSLLSIGACTLTEPQDSFYIELKPVNANATPEALAISRLSMEHLAEDGVDPVSAMANFESWVKEVTPDDQRPVFLAFNAPFDWMFVNDYFHRYLGHNPFGHTALDIKAYFMGLNGVSWFETSMAHISRYYQGDRQLTHHALRDALDQAEIFNLMLAEAESRLMR
jgi:DNA polymerase III epsilon subunit-like protein